MSTYLAGAIDKFYSLLVNRGYDYESIPIMVSVVTFPSTEIWIGAAQEIADKCYGKSARDLKLTLYQTDDIRLLSDKNFQKKALDFITSEGIKNIFKDVPESRSFLKILSLAKLE